MKKIGLILGLAALMTLLFTVPVSAHGGGHHKSGKHAAPNSNYYTATYALCPVEDCKVYGPHDHEGKWYCNQQNVNWNNYGVCAVSGCAEPGLHEHNETWYHCSNYITGGGYYGGGHIGGHGGKRR